MKTLIGYILMIAGTALVAINIPIEATVGLVLIIVGILFWARGREDYLS